MTCSVGGVRPVSLGKGSEGDAPEPVLRLESAVSTLLVSDDSRGTSG